MLRAGRVSMPFPHSECKSTLVFVSIKTSALTAHQTCGSEGPTASDSAFPPCGPGHDSCDSNKICQSIQDSCTGSQCQGVCIPKPPTPPTSGGSSGGSEAPTVYRYCQEDSSNCRSGEYCVRNPRSPCGAQCAQSFVCVEPRTTCGGSDGVSCPRNQFCVDDSEYCFVSGNDDGECVGICV
ncbi:hypothetical protein P152DRAFT_139103 [Eremomyces bilateralis CBS 781.70]|uniref:Uncharacterized protein n=1 Tax=Eremomyces bilateralis CBS 781.70 TaxID=1392243 RepID=A0A6G1FWK6_9PEZI|nr:uncharacterized protein P152DRAFT_139103 [Eremomyces bilateralis CBS 781.70]KAF1810071.1 hypothetical protein P152DRAFT_139103 [Eremomyces bilateralis CBS 781.70]